jgi:hypothetical protein
MLSAVIFFLMLAVVTGVLAVTVKSALASAMFGVALALFLGSGFAYMRRRPRR